MIVAVVVGFGVIFAFLVVLISCGVSNGFFFVVAKVVISYVMFRIHSVQWPSCFYEFCDMCILFFMNFVAWRDVVGCVVRVVAVVKFGVLWFLQGFFF